MNRIPDGYSMRPTELADAEALAAFANDYMRDTGSGETISAERLAGQLSMPGLDLATSARLVFSPKGEIVASGLIIDLRDPHVRVSAYAMVSEAHTGKGIGTALHAWMQSRAGDAVNQAPEGTRVVLEQTIPASNEKANDFLRLHGYEQTRHFWRMGIRFDGPPPAPQWPEGIEVRVVDPEKDIEAAVTAAAEAFQDHYGHVPVAIEERVKHYRHRMDADPTYDQGLDFLAWDGDQVAGICFGATQTGSDTATAYIPTLGIRRTWRKRGLGLALLLHAFGEFQRRGKTGAALHVDAQSLTGATRLYEKAGMQVDELSHEYTLELRPGIDLMTK